MRISPTLSPTVFTSPKCPLSRTRSIRAAIRARACKSFRPFSHRVKTSGLDDIQHVYYITQLMLGKMRRLRQRQKTLPIFRIPLYASRPSTAAPFPNPATAAEPARRIRIVAAIQKGFSYDEIARDEAISHERVRQIVVETMRRNDEFSRDLRFVQAARLAICTIGGNYGHRAVLFGAHAYAIGNELSYVSPRASMY
jgi:hypothetical protein